MLAIIKLIIFLRSIDTSTDSLLSTYSDANPSTNDLTYTYFS